MNDADWFLCHDVLPVLWLFIFSNANLYHHIDKVKTLFAISIPLRIIFKFWRYIILPQQLE
jgi:hypothetical protein